MLTTSEAFDASALAASIAAATVLGADVKAGLYTNTPVIGKKLTVADLVEAAYTGYVRQLVVMGAPARDPVNGIVSVAAGLTWQQTGSPVPAIINGIFYVTGAAQAVFLGINPFEVPIPLNDDLDFFVSILEFIQSNGNAGQTTIVR